MSDRKRILVLSMLVMAGGMFCTAAVTIAILYQTTLEDEREELMEIASGQAHFMEVVARFDAIHSQDDHPGGAREATLSQIVAAHEHYPEFGETGEFIVAEREGDQIVFLFPYRHGDGSDPDPIPWRSELAEPMRQALAGQEGTLVGLDYRGERVLAAYHPVAVLNLGVVAKADMAEIRAPFVVASAVATGVTVLLILVGLGLTLRVTAPLLRRLGLFQRFTEESGHGLAMADLDRRITYVNPALCRMLGLESPEEVLGKTFDPFYPEAVRRRVAEEVIPTVLAEGQWQGELAQLSKRGQVYPTDENIFLIRDAQGNPACLANIMADISERKRAEQVCQQARDEAEASAERATRAMDEMQRMNAMMMDREQRVLEMKQEVNDLLAQLGQTRKYEHV